MAPALPAHARALERAAPTVGAEVRTETADGRVLRFQREGARVRVLDGIAFDAISVVQVALCDDKRDTKRVLESAGLPVAAGASADDPAAIEALLTRGPVVVKPGAGTGGQGVRVDLRTQKDVQDALAACEDGFVEAMAPGQDVRVHVLGGRVVAACVREPAHVIGDGQRTVEDAIENHARWIASFNEANVLVVDEELLASELARLGLAAEDVLPEGARLELNRLCNVAQGAVPIDVTDRLHARYGEWVRALYAETGFEVFAIDFVAPDLSTDPADNGAVALEVNGQPDWLHHTVSRRRTHPMAELLLEHFLRRAKSAP